MVFIGFPSSGKSTLNFFFNFLIKKKSLDTDVIIEKFFFLLIEYFLKKKNKEIKFRIIENFNIKIISLGGGFLNFYFNIYKNLKNFIILVKRSKVSKREIINKYGFEKIKKERKKKFFFIKNKEINNEF
ncbi:hypothetical protein [Candidatus Vidania fulgoroideorum]